MDRFKYRVSGFETEDSIREEFYVGERLHRRFLPAVIEIDKISLQVSLREYWERGALHRYDGPAVEINTANQRIEKWYIDGNLGRFEDEPAVQIWSKSTGNPVRQEYYSLGQLHRMQGPAVIVFDPTTGAVLEKQYFRNGLAIDNDDPHPPSL